MLRIALARRHPENCTAARSVVAMYSSRFARVAGPALREAMLETTSMYSISGSTLMIAWTSGIDACPPQVTMLTLRAATHASRFTAGMHKGPTPAGVRSTTLTPRRARMGACLAWAAAEVASKTRSQDPGFSSRYADPVGRGLGRPGRAPSSRPRRRGVAAEEGAGAQQGRRERLVEEIGADDPAAEDRDVERCRAHMERLTRARAWPPTRSRRGHGAPRLRGALRRSSGLELRR